MSAVGICGGWSGRVVGAFDRRGSSTGGGCQTESLHGIFAPDGCSKKGEK